MTSEELKIAMLAFYEAIPSLGEDELHEMLWSIQLEIGSRSPEILAEVGLRLAPEALLVDYDGSISPEEWFDRATDAAIDSLTPADRRTLAGMSSRDQAIVHHLVDARQDEMRRDFCALHDEDLSCVDVRRANSEEGA